MSDSGVRTLAQIPEASEVIDVGDVVRLTSDRTIGLALADSSDNIAGTLGVALTTSRPLNIVVCGDAAAKLELGLVPFAGQSLWVSPTVPGRLTTVAPTTNAVFVGVVKDASMYSSPSNPFVLASVAAVVNVGALNSSAEVALWDITKVRYFFVDYDNGSDANRGYIDAAAGTTFTPTETGAVAVKTLTRLRAILPYIGNGRMFNVLIAARASGATYRNPADTADDNLDVRFMYGFARSIVRGSDLTNSTADQLTCGGIIAATGPNSDGSWTAGPATTTTLTPPAGSLPTDLAGTGLRVRFTGTVTAALANVNRNIQQISGGVVTLSSSSGVTADALDTFFIEKPGVAVAQILIGNSDITASSVGGLAVVGVTAVSTTTPVQVVGSAGVMTLAFIHTTSTSTSSCQFARGSGTLTIGSSYVNDAGLAARAAGGNRFTAPVTVGAWQGVVTAHSSGFMAATGSGVRALRFDNCPQVVVSSGGGAVTCNAGLTINKCGANGALINNFPPVVVGRGTSTFARLRVLATSADGAGIIFVNGSAGLVQGVDITGMGGSACVRLLSAQSAFAVLDAVGTTGNTGVGLLLSSAGSSIACDSANTMSGTAGDISYAVPAGGVTNVIGTWADLALTNVIDGAGNNVYQSTVAVLGNSLVGQATLITNANGSALAVGQVVRTNGTSGQVVAALADSTGHATGVVGVMVTAPANGALGFMVSPGNGTPYILYDGAPTAGGLAYLSPTAPGKATTTVPAGTKLKLGYNVDVSGATGHTSFLPDLVPS